MQLTSRFLGLEKERAAAMLVVELMLSRYPPRVLCGSVRKAAIGVFRDTQVLLSFVFPVYTQPQSSSDLPLSLNVSSRRYLLPF
jgi:hypothetical protein